MVKSKTARSAMVMLLVLTLAAPLAAAVAAPSLPAVTVALADAPQTETTYYTSIRVNGAAMTEDPVLTDVNGQTYVAVRPVAQALDAEVQTAWDGNTAIFVHWGLVELSAVPGMDYVVANNRYFYVPNQVQAVNGAICLPLEVVCKVFEADCVANADGTFDLTTTGNALVYGGAFYDNDDLYWLSRIINAESGNQPLSGKVAVGNVILNRVQDSRFPNTVKGVIFQKNQFTPVSSGTINRTPNAESVLAAKLCLDGGVALDNVLYFNRAGLHCWASSHRPFVATIAGHSFYA